MAEAFPKEPLVAETSASEADNETNHQQYEIHVKTDDDNEEDYENTQHVISLIKNGDNPENKKMYFNHDQLHGNNFSWNDKSGITFHNGADGEFVGGHFEFNHNRTSGLGSFQQGEIRKPAKLLLKPAEFNVALSKNAGAHIEQEGIGLKLTWDTKSTAWKDAHWTEKALEYSYSVNIGGPKIAGQDTYIYNATFTDPETGVEWKVDNNPGNFNGYVTVTIDENGRIVFNKNDTKQPPDPKRTDKEFPSVFPDDMVYDMNEIGTMFSGAMSFGTNVKTASVYAIQGSLNNPFILGHYMLYSKGRPQSTFAVSRGKMLVDNTQVSKSGVKHSTLWWNDLSSKHSDVTGLPTNGAIDFSKDGSNGLMFRKSTQEPLLTVKPRNFMATQSLSTTNLNIYGLMAMDPNSQSKSGTTDVVQEEAMQDFYKIIQYYMDDQLRQDFLSLNPPDMTEILNIAVDNRIENSNFFGFLSFPYLVHALSTTKEKLSNELNGVRASKMLNQGLFFNNAYKNVYQDQTQKLYTLRFEKKFPLMSQYLLDQKANSSKYSALISSDIASWTKLMRTTTVADTPETKKALDDSIAIVENLSYKAIAEQLYWAFVLFRYSIAPYFINWLQATVLDTKSGSQTLALTIKKIVTLFQVLDPSGEFSVAFLDFIKQYQYFNILPQLLDLANLTTDFNIIMQDILNSFVNEYISSTDAQMSATAQQLQAELKKNQMIPFMDALRKTILINKGGAWSTIIGLYEQRIANEFGTGKLNLAKLYSTGISVLAVVFVITGTNKWSAMSPVSKTGFIKLSIKLFQNLSSKIITGALKARAAFIAGDNSYVRAMSTFFLGEWTFKNKPATYLENGFAKWLVDTNGPKKAVGKAALNAAANAQELSQAEESITKMKIAFGNNLNEFLSTRMAAIFSVINLVLSSILVSKSSTGLEKAMNGIFVASSILDLVSAVGGWTLSLVATEYDTALATVFGFASGLSIIAGVIGCILLIVILSKQKKTPPSPLETFVTNQATKAGYRMLKGVDIDYFQVIETNSQTDKIGLTISESSIFQNCIKISSTKNFELAALTHASDTVWEVNTDEFGYASFATFIYSGNSIQQGVYIKLKNGTLVAEGSISGDPNEEKWICEITDIPSYDTITKVINGNTVVQKFLKSGTFTIKNVATWNTGVNDYLNVVGGKLVVNTTPMKWVLTMQGMKPSHLSMKNILLDKLSINTKSYPILLEPGSDYEKKWTLTPNLPDFITFDSKTGTISQSKAVVNFHQTFELTVSNHYGSTKSTFKIDASIL